MSEIVYLDNAATTPLDRGVVEEISNTLITVFGNPSSIHQVGRQAKAKVETVRKLIAQNLNVHPSEIVFTSGGTESNNLALRGAVKDLGVKHIISSKIEHHSVENTLLDLNKLTGVQLHFVEMDSKGNVDLKHLALLLENHKNALVSLMHGNNEIGTILPLKEVSQLCAQYKAYFHSDTVQTIGHLQLDLQQTPISFLSFSAHKIHGPKGVGFAYINKNNKVSAVLTGGSQERGFRAGTENVAGIAGMGKAFEIAYAQLKKNEAHLKSLKQYFQENLKAKIKGVVFNGEEGDKALSGIVNVGFPAATNTDMLLFSLDMKGIQVSGGSACSSGSNKGSHVLEALGSDPQKSNIRFSFSRFTTKEEINKALEVLEELLG